MCAIWHIKTIPPNMQRRSILIDRMRFRRAVSDGLALYKPTCAITRAFHRARARIKALFGGNRSGKTQSAVADVVAELEGRHILQRLGLRPRPPVHWRCVGVNFPAVEKILIPAFRRWTSRSALKGGTWSEAWSERKQTLTFENGSTCEFMSYDQDLDVFGGVDRDGTLFDEEPPKDIWTECQMRHIGRGGRTVLAMTPVNGMTWVYDDIYEPWHLGTTRSIACWYLSIYDNPHLLQEEIEEVARGLDETEQQIRLHGRFLQRTGLVFKEFHDREPWVYNPFQMPLSWPRWVLIDPHPHKPHAVLFGAVSPSGERWVYDEIWQACGMEDLAGVIRGKLGGIEPQDFIVDSAALGQDERRGTTVYDELADNGIHCSLASKDVDSGIIRLRAAFEWNALLKPDRPMAYRVEPPALPTGGPGLHISRDCRMVRHQMARYVWPSYMTARARENNDAPRRPRKKDDDFVDLLRYFEVEEPQYVEVHPSGGRADDGSRWRRGEDEDEDGVGVFGGLAEYETDWMEA